MASDCIRIPSDEELSSRGTWRKSGSDTYSAVRAHIMVVKRKEKKRVRKGRLHSPSICPPAANFNANEK